MKGLITLTLCALFSIAAYSATVQRTILSHKGTITQYDANHWQDAISDAVAGDTVYFTSGVFSGDISIDKPITLIGAGIGTLGYGPFWKDSDYATVFDGCATSGNCTEIIGQIVIDISGNIVLNSTLLEGFITRDPGYITIKQPVQKLKIKRCQLGPFGAEATVTDAILEDCYLGEASFTNFVNPDIHNCFIRYIDSCPEEIAFWNCSIKDIWDTWNCSFINCILHFAGPNTASHNTCQNSINDEHNSGSGNTWFDSWEDDGFHLTKSQLQDKGYIGTDGTVVGPLGGSAPFTLIPSQPYVASGSVTYNKSTKKLNVNVTVKKGQ